MERLIAGGTGLIGQQLVHHWLKQKHIITVVGRDVKKIQQCFGNKVSAMSWENFTKLPEHQLKAFESITNLCGANIGTSRWTPKRKKIIINSRVQTTEKIVDKLLPLADQAPRLFNASAIGIYGAQATLPHHLPTSLDETHSIEVIHPANFLQEIGLAWEQATDIAKARGIHVINLRFGVVLTYKGGAFEKLVTPFKLGFLN